MGRKEIEVDRPKFIKLVLDAEANGPLATQQMLFELVSKQYGDPKLTPAVVGLRIKKWNLTIKTKSARGAGRKMSEEHKAALIAGRAGIKRTPRKDKLKDVNFEGITKECPPSYSKTLEQLKQGSLKAAVKLQCLQCAGWEKVNVKLCTCDTTCMLYHIRPYQLKPGEVLQEEIEKQLSKES